MKLVINTDKKYTETEIIVNCDIENRDVDKLIEAIRAVTYDEPLYVKEDTKIKGIKDGKQYFIETVNIIFTDTTEGRSYIYTHDGCYENTMKLYELEKLLYTANFMRANKSCLFNFDAIESIENDPDRRIILTMTNDMKVIVSRQYAKEVKRRLGVYHA